MSLQAAVQRVDQIIAWQQGVVAPASAPAAPAGATSAATTGAGSFSGALASAQAAYGSGGAGLTAGAGLTGLTGSAGLTGAAADPASQVQAMTTMADSLVGKPYVWGGGHGGWGPQTGYDCSGFVSAVLHAGGYLSQPADTTSMPNQPGIESGPGQYVTIYDRAQPGDQGHVIIDLNGQFYESGGSAGPWGGGGGVEKIARPSDSYLATFPQVLHPAGL